jgi:hypothetical protein
MPSRQIDVGGLTAVEQHKAVGVEFRQLAAIGGRRVQLVIGALEQASGAQLLELNPSGWLRTAASSVLIWRAASVESRSGPRQPYRPS